MKRYLLSASPLTGRLRLQNLAIVFVVIVLCAGLLTLAWRSYQRASDADQAFDALRATLLAMEKASAERGPANAVLGADLPLPQEAVSSLRAAREATNAQLDRLLYVLSSDHCESCGTSLRAVEKARLDLAAASANVDLLVQRPRELRSDAAVRDAVSRMIRVIADFSPVASTRIDVVARGAPEALHYIILARLAADLREYAGQLGSQFTASLTTGQTLTEADQRAIERILGRIEQLREMITSRLSDPSALRPGIVAALNTQYFGAGLHYVATVRTLASQPKPAPFSTATFARQYVPTMRSITDFRDEMLNLAQAEVEARRTYALRLLIATAVIEITVVLLIYLVMRNFRRNVVYPLETAAGVIDALAKGDPHMAPISEAPSMHRPEVRTMFKALRILQLSGIELMQLRRERARLVGELEMLSDTDPLTRLLNWRAFERHARALCAMPAPGRVALIKFDIDNFTQINATWGHHIGDDLLRRVSAVCLNTCQPGDVVGRLGADAFVVLARVLDESRAQQFAELLRGRIEASTLPLGDGAVLTITASFGIAMAKPATVDSAPAHEADAADGASSAVPDISALLSQAERELRAARQAGAAGHHSID
ncbi:Diguanylate cyclase DosC [Pandoraea pneumonica]|uniref:diguanylate cyclase n=1 Tax=Pandoraea pneumonica TaxID=2508299 RepID=A0A5E4SP46_9BURK|nr:GGDEF domain-containing protein [Pandoraea pneumonica]VVD76871.1 Diguanylate cyclase DosC [Pandoraea pneumonica]